MPRDHKQTNIFKSFNGHILELRAQRRWDMFINMDAHASQDTLEDKKECQACISFFS